jgi:hypothetical protein
VPYTGIADNLKLYFFLGFIALLSALIAYSMISYQKSQGELN